MLFNQRFLARLRRLHHHVRSRRQFAAAGAADGSSRYCSPPHHGDVALPADYLTWRTVRPTLPRSPVRRLPPPFDELDYVHPAYLPPVQHNGFRPLFTIEGNTFKVRPVDDRAGAYEFHYYQKIPTLVGTDLNTNWLLTEYPNAYLFGLMVEAAGARPQCGNGATLQGAAR